MGFHSKLVALAVLSPATLVQAIATFAITNIDDIVVLAVMFGQAPGHRGAAIRVTAGQYLASPPSWQFRSAAHSWVPRCFLQPHCRTSGCCPSCWGLRAAWLAWRDRRTQPAPTDDPATLLTPGTWQVAVITFANGGDNIGVYVPIFAVSTIATIGVYIIVFLIGVAIWCAAGRYFASHPIIAKALSRWGHIVLPVALITIGGPHPHQRRSVRPLARSNFTTQGQEALLHRHVLAFNHFGDVPARIRYDNLKKRAVAKVLKGRSRHPNYQHERAHHRIMIVCHERHDHSSYTEDVPEPTESTGDHSGYPAALAAGRGSRVAPRFNEKRRDRNSHPIWGGNAGQTSKCAPRFNENGQGWLDRRRLRADG